MTELDHFRTDQNAGTPGSLNVHPVRRLFGWMRIFLLASGLAVLMVIGYDAYFELPGERSLHQQLTSLRNDFRKLDTELNSLKEVVTTIEKRDDEVYRAVLGMNPVDKSFRAAGIGGSDRSLGFREDDRKYGQTMALLFAKISKLRRKLLIESLSQDELISQATERQRQFSAIPGIEPIANPELTALASGFGLRLHPIYNVIKMHTGVDFSCAPGTPVNATADGEVIAVDTAVCGYGKMITLDHGYGYQTRYGHLQEFRVKVGDKVRRGFSIARSGNTGVSTAPHLHYEVLLHGIQINPVQYFFDDLTALEYEKIVLLGSAQNRSLGN